MNFEIFDIVAIVLLFVCNLFAYMYFCLRSHEDHSEVRNLKILTHKKEMLFSCILFVSSLVSFFVGKEIKGYSLPFLYMNIAVLALVGAMAGVDMEEKIIPNHLILVGLLLGVLQIFLQIFVLHKAVEEVLLFSLFSAFIWGGTMILLSFVLKKALGMGDAKMILVLGFIYGFNITYEILLISLAIMAIVSIILLLLKKVTKKTAIPMAPFVYIGMIICTCAGM